MLKIGHRGAPGYPRYGENTIASFAKALAIGADAVELDVRRSKDNKLVVIHDKTLDRTTNGHGLVSDFTYDELRMFDAGRACHIPLLENVLDIFGQHYLINIELKESGLMDEVVHTALAKKAQVLISSFDADDGAEYSDSSWEELKIWSGRIDVALLATMKKVSNIGVNNFISAAKEHRATAISLQKPVACFKLDIVKKAHKEGLTVFAWTVNRRFEAEYLKRLGIDGIFSDRPEIL
ncbi:MAG: hypothetical protein A2831_00075 [Candidatus Yanofskybacteria bacterium RIFCSPHIGHO2_01_FULL_44_17]|uniref:GP-PDE domain-containing protein n=1 Tax=Candidatus Yanofskybacteria bacterium RIFCSPHIGHO2_01_FULL_44_17 TaxID=1802668 RepID=A0A1F8ESV0_9BACT|nr:MAG: hypothetical protein A2831_00075 [Candidatus Yanofskybacteria bacterium RIFCSPHIGHO2_01_FULL_44_17]